HVLSLLQSNFRDRMDVGRLTTAAHMSVSAFHRAFKDMTGESPIQYLKKLRLNKAKDLMLQSNMKAGAAAYEVGYESASQFSREFKRYFGASPAEMIRAARAA
ncbi:MAG: AraC family transcriptional regulator, partial [Verrucomicrobiota bacterium]